MEQKEDRLRELIAYLVINRNNLKKSPNRVYLENNLKSKLQICKVTHSEALEKLASIQNKLEKSKFDLYSDKLESVYGEILQLIKSKLNKMALDLGLALKIGRSLRATP